MKTRFLTVSAIVISGCATSTQHPAPQVHRPSFVESVTSLPDGSKEIVVYAQFSAASGSNKVYSVNLKELLQKAASAECNNGPYTATPDGNGQIAPGKSGPLKFTLKGTVRCG
jgi:hypothetical protein